MRLYSVRLFTCSMCPHLRKLTDRDTQIDWCRAASRILDLKPVESKIPEWCPLPEAEDEISLVRGLLDQKRRAG